MAKELLDIIYCFKQWAPVLELQIVLTYMTMISRRNSLAILCLITTCPFSLKVCLVSSENNLH